ncbi:hypothetical protein PPYR_11811 [Photinus pyralis]|uniref:Superoxide dismutase copper/zinc binding domain-containing protein n=2 Tax=Photinus pyralis TaxID=7054 RepID=A0A1Y1N277_PHOPY|nr:uncharacterized protein LOC116175783 [Photinus pyralis]KAB0794972.1 hypothetical protein PPYR_11811 [Photinus pyralis]
MDMICLNIILISIFIHFSTASFELRAYISQEGLHGTVTFTKVKDAIKINTNLNATLQYPNQIWSWSITEFPTDYSHLENRCESSKLGNTLVNLDDVFGFLYIPENMTAEFLTTTLRVGGESGIYGKSLLLRNTESNKLICASIVLLDKTMEKVAVAKFRSPVSGSVFFKWFATKDNDQEMLITTDLYRVSKTGGSFGFTQHSWKIYATDLLHHDDERIETSCNILQLVFDPNNKGDGLASGDIDTRVGKVKVATNYRRQQYKTLFRDEELILLPSDLTGPQRRLYLVIFDDKHENSFLTCAKIRYETPVTAKIIIQSGGIKGELQLTQRTQFEPTFLNFNLSTAKGDLETSLVYSSSVAGYRIHELPIAAAKTVGQMENSCLTTKFYYNPLKINVNMLPPNGYGTQDQYPVGDLSGKLLGRNKFVSLVEGGQELSGQYWDVFLPLQGQFSVIHRSLVIYKNTQYPTYAIMPEPWICGAIVLYEQNFKYQKQMFTAEVLIRYPIVAKILFRQPKDEPWSDTSILTEYLIHADGSQVNNSLDHRWAIHEFPPGKDFYNWTARCVSAGLVYNPYKVDFDNKSSINNCSTDTIGYCRAGDLSKRLGNLDISGTKANSERISRKLFTDQLLPLNGPNSIVGKSIVLYDDFGPKARGERLACAKIGAIYRRKAVAKDWFSNGDVTATIQGKIEFFQQTEHDITNVEVSLAGLQDNRGYHVHITPIQENLQFPCEASTLYDHWNPLNVDSKSSPKNYYGTPDQYEMGDLSGKFGTLDNHTIFKQDYNDTMLPLFGPRSILGRSIVVEKRVKGSRWACTTIERGYSPSEAREIRAIASFHHPQGHAYGYMRMKQLIYSDGSQSDTIIEINLRHPGKHDSNITRDHHWAIYVNPVGVDAAVKTQNTRCVAGGYVWNPYYTQLADPLNTELYRQECGPDNPLRCYVGDVSARVGTIDLGLRRSVVVDTNFPLEGQWSAIGRSIVILSPNKQPERYACANIEPDYDIIKYANIDKPPRFVLAQFIEDVCKVMGIPEWMLTVDSRQTKILHGGACMQILLHFKGPIANKLEQDFSRLISTGRLDSPSLYIHGFIDTKRKVKISYKQCGKKDPNDNKSRFGWFGSGSYKFSASQISLVFVILIQSCV